MFQGHLPLQGYGLWQGFGKRIEVDAGRAGPGQRGQHRPAGQRLSEITDKRKRPIHMEVTKDFL